MRLHQSPRHPLAFGPSRLQHLRRLCDHLGGQPVLDAHHARWP